MNFIRKIGCSGEDITEIRQPPKIDRWVPSSSASHQQRYCQPQQQQHEPQQQPKPFLSPLPYHPHNRCGWVADSQSPVGEPSSNKNEEERGMLVEREHMFDKVVTPSDVGKLNRLVIPKQHAERYFPLDSSNNDKGLLLNFEDMNGKLWRFRYSYWNSSQSYVMTKGWSRFVKEKKLDAGDIVSFQRGVGATSKDRLFIDCRRRVNSSSPSHQLSSSNISLIHPWNPLVLQSFPAKRNPNMILQPPNNNFFYNTNWDGNNLDRSRSFYFGPSVFGAQQQHVQMMQRNGFGFGVGVDPSPTSPSLTQPVHGKSSGKRLRLFGVNMDCSFSEEENEQDPHHRTLIPSPSSSSSFSTIPYLQLNSYGGGTECNPSSILSSSSSAHDFNIVAKSTASNMSLDLDI